MSDDIRSAQPHWASAEFVEQRVLPMLLCLVVGITLGAAIDAVQWRQERDAAQRAAAGARAELASWRNACQPLLTLPPQAAPLVFPASDAGARYTPTAAGAR